uniref:Uncharacterized protein n=1 Tax=Chromera velia CCMP2878 TaxID=1169474 RepID=A0A0G4HEQ9_9ALVE|eukprot:Cvel_6568.t1-p1 / transcript=Cvel_6568.t1 / gene=Cvel_6568 / organism=Chromera_velia_CCMP2878 / gene_product=hypothetical protein / transcript_product=hypothetical protein / location=Cvel_scaffold324:2853-5399(-) / protein_length=849 / sequence_SO=supercontig / SO=protein_coding / is_pseudo=false
MLLRKTFSTTADFVGLEEPSMPLPLFARADLAVRPAGCKDDLWLPIQVKSTTVESGGRDLAKNHSDGSRSRFWEFSAVRGYHGMPILCVSVANVAQQQQSPRVWLFSEGCFGDLRGTLRITEGGKYDTKDRRCTLDPQSPSFYHTGKALLRAWVEARAGEGPYELQCIQALQTQLSRAHLAEWTMLQKCRELFSHVPGGLEMREAVSPVLPHDIELRCPRSPDMRWQRVQLKSASWDRARRGLGYIHVTKMRGSRFLPYDEGDFDFLLVSQPQNKRLFTIKNSHTASPTPDEQRWRYFYFIPVAALVREGVVASENQKIKGVKSFRLDFETDSRLKRGFRPLRLVGWRLDTSAPEVAGQRVAQILYGESRRGLATYQKYEKWQARPVPAPQRCGVSETRTDAMVKGNSHPSSQKEDPPIDQSGSHCSLSGPVDRVSDSAGTECKSTFSENQHKLSIRDLYAVERAAIELLRQSFRPTEFFDGLEEPLIPLPHFARADLAVRPFGSTEDLWLPVQTKSTGQRTRNRPNNWSPVWHFYNVRGYRGVPVICISFERDVEEGGVHQGQRVWLFSDECFEHLKHPGRLAITEGGKHDNEGSRCSFVDHSPSGRHVGRVLLCIWQDARKAQGPYQLYSLRTLQTQLSPNHLAEWRMLQNCLELFEHVPGGIDVREAPWPCDPHDIEIRPSGLSAQSFRKVQLKSAIWTSQSQAWPGIAFVKSCKMVCKKRRPYEEHDFDYLLVGPPRNSSRLSHDSKKRLTTVSLNDANQLDPNAAAKECESHRFLYVIPQEVLICEGVVASGDRGHSRGVQGFYLDFSSRGVFKRPSRISRLLKWRLSLSDLQDAGLKAKTIFL